MLAPDAHSGRAAAAASRARDLPCAAPPRAHAALPHVRQAAAAGFRRAHACFAAQQLRVLPYPIPYADGPGCPRPPTTRLTGLTGRARARPGRLPRRWLLARRAVAAPRRTHARWTYTPLHPLSPRRCASAARAAPGHPPLRRSARLQASRPARLRLHRTASAARPPGARPRCAQAAACPRSSPRLSAGRRQRRRRRRCACAGAGHRSATPRHSAAPAPRAG